MNRYTVRGFGTGIVNANGTDCIAVFWNPSSTRRIEVVEFALFTGDRTTVNFEWLVSRTTTQGATPTATVTPDADNAHQADSVPPSGALLYQGPFGTAPTISTPPLYGAGSKGNTTNTDGQDGWWLVFPSFEEPYYASTERPIVLPPGTGLAMHMSNAGITMTNHEVIVGFED